MCEAIGHPVRRLVRTRIGPISDRQLGPGHWRALTTSEVRALERATTARPRPGRPQERRPKGPQKQRAQELGLPDSGR
jgi:23S rRNA pseudouridine2605 synthase